MPKNENVVEDALFQIKNLEETLQENAKGILQSTMSEEIKQLVKESLKEQEEIEEPSTEDEEMDMEDDEMEMDMEDDEMEMDDEEMDMEDDEMDMEDDEMEMDDEEMDMEDEDAIDLTDASDEEVLRVFRAMSDEDGIVVKQEGDFIHLTDEDDDYLIQLGESYEEEDLEEEELGYEEDTEEEYLSEYDDEDEMGEETIYELEMDDEMSEEDMDDEMSKETIYEIEMEDDFEEIEIDEMEDYSDSLEEEELDIEDAIMEAIKKSIKPKGVGIGKGPKFKYDSKPNMGMGFNEKKKEAFGKGTKAMGTGKAKFEYKEGENMEKGSMKKAETKESSRTLGSGKRWGKKGLDKPKAAPRHLRVESTTNELNLLREKNEEYKQALDVFRTKLNEVAVFNSNLAYATRLFTEHSTTKQEKINILRRFDNVESLKESKNLYRTIKNELSSDGSVGEQKLTESIERTVNKTVETGSAVNLIESKTYENPQFLRMKDLMGKLK